MSYKTLDLSTEAGSYYKLQDGQNRCRIVSEAVPVWTAFDRVNKTAKKYLNELQARTDPEAKKRFALWVIDRNDGQIKLAEWGVSIMKQIQTLALDKDYTFDSFPSYDIKITRSGSGLDTEYTVTPSPVTPFTEEEAARVAGLENVEAFMKKQPCVVPPQNMDAPPV